MSTELYLYAGLAVIALIGIFIITTFLRPQKPAWKEDVKIKINEISRASNTKEQMVLSTLLFEADKLLDHTLKMYRVKGETMGERLKSARNLYERDLYNRIWEAHKMRNNIAHEHGYSVSSEKIQNSINNLLSGTRKLVS